MKRRGESGQTLWLVAVVLVALLGFAGLAVDMGVMRYEKRLQQTAVDAAAIAGAKEIPYLGGVGVALAAQSASSTNGFTMTTGDTATGDCSTAGPTFAAVGTVCIQVDRPPTIGPHAGDSNYVEAYVSAVHPTYFMKVFGVGSETVTTRAVATLVGENGNNPGCIYTLGPPGTGIGVTSSGTPSVNAPTCGIYDAGNWTTNGAPVNISAGTIGVTGGGTNNGGGTVTCTDTSVPCPQTNLPPLGDPLSYLTPPPVGTASTGLVAPSGVVTTFVPGTYSSITVNSQAEAIFSPGIYVVDGGSFKINGGAEVCGGGTVSDWSSTAWANTTAPACSYASDGVMFYLTNGASVSINGTSTVQMYAPETDPSSTEPYAGILFYQDPSDTSAASLNGTNSSFYQGALYFPGAQLQFGGTNFTNSLAQYTIIVADDLKFYGTSTVFVNSDYSSLPGGVSIIKNAILVE